MTVAIVLAFCGVVVSVLGWCYLTRRPRHRTVGSGAAASTEGSPTTAFLRSMAHPRHRWSGPRPRWELTDKGLQDSGPQVRFCLDCSAERTELSPRKKMGAT